MHILSVVSRIVVIIDITLILIDNVSLHCLTISLIHERTGAVGSASDFGSKGPRYDPRQGPRLLWP